MAEVGTAIAFSIDSSRHLQIHGCARAQPPLGLGASIQTSTVVLLGSSAGLISVTLPSALKSPGAVIVAGSTDLQNGRFILRKCAFAMTDDVSMIVNSAVPAVGVSPGYKGRSVTTPSIGLRISV